MEARFADSGRRSPRSGKPQIERTFRFVSCPNSIMTAGTPTYRWNTSTAAEDFDQAAEFIHPRYLRVQEEVISQLPFDAGDSFLVVDLGAGSGRLVERILERFPNSRGVLVDQSEPFLAIAERRLHR